MTNSSTSPAHTAGPWEVKKALSGSLCIRNGYGFYLAEIFQGEGIKEEIEANARLIAAAPELLDVCKMMLPYLDHVVGQSNTNKARTNAQAAIAKAEGK